MAENTIRQGDVVKMKGNGKSRYVVERAFMSGAGMDRFTPVPDWLHVEARLLNEDGSYSRDNLGIKLYDEGLAATSCTVVGKMIATYRKKYQDMSQKELALNGFRLQDVTTGVMSMPQALYHEILAELPDNFDLVHPEGLESTAKELRATNERWGWGWAP